MSHRVDGSNAARRPTPCFAGMGLLCPRTLGLKQLYSEHQLERQMSDRSGARARAKPASPQCWHRGWQVEGVPPNAEQIAQAAHEAAVAAHRTGKAWDSVMWLRNAKLHKIAPPFGSQSAAHHCAEVARRAGWQRVGVTELKSEGAHADAAVRAPISSEPPETR